MIKAFVYKSYGHKLQHGFYLSFLKENCTLEWIDRALSIKEAFKYARRCLDGRHVVFLRLWARLESIPDIESKKELVKRWQEKQKNSQSAKKEAPKKTLD